MSTEAIKSIQVTFEAREETDRAVEHLVQEYGIDRSHIFVEAGRRDNTSGTIASGGDTSGKAGEQAKHRRCHRRRYTRPGARQPEGRNAMKSVGWKAAERS